MGCTSSIHPSIYNGTYGKDRPLEMTRQKKTRDASCLQGDYSQLQVAKHRRHVQIRDRQNEIFSAADEMSYCVMEEREMLSLGTRSRATSRNTSRAASPTSNRRSVHFRQEDQPMTPVTEADPLHKEAVPYRDSGGSEEKRLKSLPVQDDSGVDVRQQEERKKGSKTATKHKKKHKKQKKSKGKDVVKSVVGGTVGVGVTVDEMAEPDNVLTLGDHPELQRESPTHTARILSLDNSAVIETETRLSRSSSKSDIDTKRG